MAKKSVKTQKSRIPASKKQASTSKRKETIHVCVDRPVTMLNAPLRMLHSIRHNEDNNPAKPGTKEHDLVSHFISNPHHRFSPAEGAVIAKMAIITASKWQSGTTITVSFLDGSAKQKSQVKKMAAKWLPYVDLKLSYLSSPKKGMIRISFVHDPGSWSYIGTQCLSISEDEPTMNFGWLKDNTPDAEWERVVVHEFGHAFGCIHEHQSPAGGIDWNKPAVYKYYEGPPNNWTKAEVDSNLFQKYASSQTQFTKLDRNSIMMYPIPKEFLLSGDPVGWNLHLSATDVSFIKTIYPKQVITKTAKARQTLVKSTLAATIASATVNVTFKEGLGQLDADLARNSTPIGHGHVDTSDDIRFSNVQAGDVIGITGVCSGSAIVKIDVDTVPSTPKSFGKDIDSIFVVQ